MILPRDHYYIVECEDCDYYDDCGMAPFKVQREGKRHAKQNPGHEVVVFDMTKLDPVTSYLFDPLPDVENGCPF